MKRTALHRRSLPRSRVTQRARKSPARKKVVSKKSSSRRSSAKRTSRTRRSRSRRSTPRCSTRAARPISRRSRLRRRTSRCARPALRSVARSSRSSAASARRTSTRRSSRVSASTSTTSTTRRSRATSSICWISIASRFCAARKERSPDATRSAEPSSSSRASPTAPTTPTSRSRRASSTARSSKARPASRSSRTSYTCASRASRKSMDGYVTRLDYACANHLPPPVQPGGLPTYAQTLRLRARHRRRPILRVGPHRLALGRQRDFSIDVAASIVNDDSESQPGVLVAAKDHSGSNFPWLSPNGPVTPPFASPIPNNPTFNPTAGGTVPIFFDNNDNGTYQAGIDVPYDNRFVDRRHVHTTTRRISTTARARRARCSKAARRARTPLFKPYVIEPVNTLESWDTSVNLNWQITDNVSLLSVTSYRTYEELVRGRHRRLAARGAAAAASSGSRAGDAGAAIQRDRRDRVDLTFGYLLSRPRHHRGRARRPAVCRLRLHPRPRPGARDERGHLRATRHCI